MDGKERGMPNIETNIKVIKLSILKQQKEKEE